MKKRLMALLITLLTALMCVNPVFAETENANDPTEYFDFFLSRSGDIYFTMNEIPDHVFHEADLVRSESLDLGTYMGITNNTQLAYSDEDGEWQYHIADLSLMIEELRADYPDASEDSLRYNALNCFARLYITVMTLGTVEGDTQAVHPDADGAVGLVLEYSYADTPGVPYRCTGLMSGTNAVLLMGSVDARYEAMAAALKCANPEMAQAYETRMQPTTVHIGELTATFPCVPDCQENTAAKQVYYDCFTAEYECLNAEHIEIDMSFMADPNDPDGSVLAMAEATAQGYQQSGAYDSYELCLFAPGIALIKAECPADIPMAENSVCIWSFLSLEHGPYVFYGTSSESGTAFLNSIAVAK